MSRNNGKVFKLNEAYSTKWLKKKLKYLYSDHLCFAEKMYNTKCTLFQEHDTLCNKWKIVWKRQTNVDDEAKRIVITDAKLIRE